MSNAKQCGMILSQTVARRAGGGGWAGWMAHSQPSHFAAPASGLKPGSHDATAQPLEYVLAPAILQAVHVGKLLNDAVDVPGSAVQVFDPMLPALTW